MKYVGVIQIKVGVFYFITTASICTSKESMYEEEKGRKGKEYICTVSLVYQFVPSLLYLG